MVSTEKTSPLTLPSSPKSICTRIASVSEATSPEVRSLIVAEIGFPGRNLAPPVAT